MELPSWVNPSMLFSETETNHEGVTISRVAAATEKIGIFGGSFDPVHRTHVTLALAAQKQFRLDSVLLVPAAQNPLKEKAPLLEDHLRLALLEAVANAHENWSVRTSEIEGPSPSFAIETVRAIREEHRDAELFFLLGADSFASLPKWKEAQALVELVTFLVFPRPGYDIQPPEGLAKLTFYRLETPEDPLSATEIREKMERGEPILEDLPDAAAECWRAFQASFSPELRDSQTSCMIENPPMAEALAQVETCCRALDDKKAADIRVLKVGEVTSVADYFVIASGTSAPHLRALRQAVADALREAGEHVNLDANEESGWVVLDAYDVMVHLFTPEQRQRFGLESLWKDAEKVELPELSVA